MKFTVKNYTPTTSTLQSEDYLYSLTVDKEHADRVCVFLNGNEGQKEDPEILATYFTGDQLTKFTMLVTLLGLGQKEIEEVQEKEVEYPIERFNKAGQKTYHENSTGFWKKWQYNKAEQITYYQNSDGDWKKWKYNEAGQRTYSEDSYGDWWKQEYNEAGKRTYFENSTGDWEKWEYNDQGQKTYHENSDER